LIEEKKINTRTNENINKNVTSSTPYLNRNSKIKRSQAQNSSSKLLNKSSKSKKNPSNSSLNSNNSNNQQNSSNDSNKDSSINRIKNRRSTMENLTMIE
jgi:hypothetical protein